MSLDFLAALRTGLARNVRSGEGVLLAVSGGLDSSALMRGAALIRSETGIHFEVATVDHALRAESAGEANTVLARAIESGLPGHVRRVDVPRTGNLEAEARKVRYQALESLREERGLHWIATAHTASDQAETLLMRLGRGSALRGARGIAARKGRILRPLLAVQREDCAEFVHREGVAYFADPMNLEPRFLRTRVRHELLPRLREVLGPAAVPHLASFSARASEDEAFLSGLAEAARARVTLSPGVLDCASVRALHPALQGRVLLAWLEAAGLPGADVQAVRTAVETEGTQTLARGFRVHAEGGTLRLEPRLQNHPPSPWPRVALEPGEKVHFDGWDLIRSEAGRVPSGDGAHHFTLLHEGPVTVRCRLRGDRVQGPDGHHRKLQDVFVDARVPREERDHWPLLCDELDRVMWVVGVWPRTSHVAEGRACVSAFRKGVLLSATSEGSL